MCTGPGFFNLLTKLSAKNTSDQTNFGQVWSGWVVLGRVVKIGQISPGLVRLVKLVMFGQFGQEASVGPQIL